MAKVVVAMSGGVDSSVAAALLQEQGHEVYGVTLRLSNAQETPGRTFGGCCGSKDFFDARAVAQRLGFPHYAFDYVDNFRDHVIDYFKSSYLQGETPNPCIACNQFVKFDRLLEQAQALGADYLATGHYARVGVVRPSPDRSTDCGRLPQGGRNNQMESVGLHSGVPLPLGEAGRDLSSGPGEGLTGSARSDSGDQMRYRLLKAVDSTKDQSYVLYSLSQSQLSRVLFPLGNLTKVEVREIARRHGLVNADKPDSQEICFVPNNDYRLFLREEVPAGSIQRGPIRHRDGRILGEHEGLPYYTIGQREGLGLSVGHPLYVLALERTTNTLVVGEREHLLARRLAVRDVLWVTGQGPDLPTRVSVRIRYKHQEAAATLRDGVERGAWGDSQIEAYTPLPESPIRRYADTPIHVEFDEPQSAVTPGQSAVFYDGDVVLGGGIIDHVPAN